MAEINQFGDARLSQSVDAKQCAQFEAMLADAVDGFLTVEEQAAFDQHVLGCASCRENLADAKRGAAWMGMLRHHVPEPPAGMLERILAKTSGASAAATALADAGAGAEALRAVAGGVELSGATGGVSPADTAAATPAGGSAGKGKVLPFRARWARHLDLGGLRHTLLQPRLAMTAAMAFFSIALTLNLTGVRVSELRVSDLKPSSLKRSMYEANAHVVRYYTNLRVVYELESRVRDLQRSSDSDAPVPPVVATPAQDGNGGRTGDDSGSKNDGGKKTKEQGPSSQPKRRVSPGTSRREPLREDGLVLARAVEPTFVVSGLETVAVISPAAELRLQEGETV